MKVTNIRKEVGLTRNQIDYWRLQEEKRHQREVEKENVRKANIESRDRRIAAYLQNKAALQANLITGQHYSRVDAETQRANVERERQQALLHERELAKLTVNYAQMANAKEIAGIQAGVGYANVGAQYANLAELQRSNLVREELQLLQQNEAMRHNLNLEELNWAKQAVEQQKATTEYKRQQLEQEKWDKIGYAQAVSQQALTWAQTNQSWANTELAQTNKRLAGVNAASNLIGSGANVVRAIKGGNKVEKPKPKVQWPDGSYSY